MTTSLIQKYNIPGPRYTSYPTVPYWENEGFSAENWEKSMLKTFKETNAKEGISLYIHLPFCESLCTFCGCHKRITKRHEVEHPYIEAVLKEWQLYIALFPEKPMIKEIHLGGGTPTFFSPSNLKKLITNILQSSRLALDYEFSFEGHPNNTSKEHLQTLFDLGFTRVSFGVQDYSEKVQKAINRLQSFHNVAKVTFWAKEIGYTSISHDLVFGLPFQTLEDVIDTIDKTNALHPDRISFYSYAHVPWIKGNGQRGFLDEDVPKNEIKRTLYEEGKIRLAANNYQEIGMDHFAIPEDKMYKAFKKGKLNRNFMGYTTTNTKLMIGLGVSSISDSWTAFAQNEKELETYYQLINQNYLPIFKGHNLTQEDLIIRTHIRNIMCEFQTSWNDESLQFESIYEVLESLHEMELDQLITIQNNTLKVTEAGKPFIRNICMAFDLRLKRTIPTTKIFSMTI
ncbi:MAG: oxygen-independent coproporphyrinogen III oxidase [Flavobacterium sp.]|jgi:oxygen-independent coproporphyrinogen-3 oxidase|nr:oxygen-independent coproporphyrinogen III oxidase [Flavobacterium sp.]